METATPVLPALARRAIVAPVATRRDREQFMQLPWRLYAGDPAWVPPLLAQQRRQLDPLRNPFFRHAEAQLFLCRRGGEALGRVVAFVNRAYNQLHGRRAGFFGFFEAADAEVAAELLAAAEGWLAARGMKVAVGPVNFELDNNLGLLLDAYDRPPALMSAYNPPAYPPYLEAAGYGKQLDWYAYALDRATLGAGVGELAAALRRATERCQEGGPVRFRTMRRGHFAAELARVRLIYNRSWVHNPSFVPLDEAETAFLAEDLRWIIDPKLVIFAEVGDEPIGVAISLPDYNPVLRAMDGRLLPTGWLRLLRGRGRIDGLRVFALGIVPEYRQRDIDMVFYYQTILAGLARGYQRAELSLIAESNAAMRRRVEGLGARVAKTYRVYTKPLGGALRAAYPGRAPSGP